MPDKQLCLQGACQTICGTDMWPLFLIAVLAILAMVVIGAVAIASSNWRANRELSKAKREYRHE